jgi:hypothetical protein
MRAVNRLRISPAAWAFPVLLALAIGYVSIYPTATSEPYGVALTAAGGVTIAFLAPVAAALAAWEAGRLARGGWWTLPHVRPSAALALDAIWPIVLSCGLVLLAGMATRLLPAGLVVPDIRVIFVGLVVLFAHTVAGFAIGLWIPPVIAAATILVVDYLWMAMPRSLEPLWLRHLTGDFSSCCDVSADLAPTAILGASLVAAGILAAGLLMISTRGTARRLAIAAGFATVAVAAGALAVRDLGPDPVAARPESELRCAGKAPEVCVVREHEARLDEVHTIAARAAHAWTDAGLGVPDRFIEAPVEVLGPGEARLSISTLSTRADITHSIAYAMLPPIPPCAEQGMPYPGGLALDYLLAWFDLSAGLEPAEIRIRIGGFGPDFPDPVALAEEVARASPDARAAWLTANQRSASDCAIEPVLTITER